MKRTYSKEFKVKACELVLKDGIKHAVVAEKLGINKVMLYQWISQYVCRQGSSTLCGR